MAVLIEVVVDRGMDGGKLLKGADADREQDRGRKRATKYGSPRTAARSRAQDLASSPVDRIRLHCRRAGRVAHQHRAITEDVDQTRNSARSTLNLPECLVGEEIALLAGLQTGS